MADKDNSNTMLGLGSVKVKKAEMIKKLKENRKKHKEDYDEAKAEYKLCYMEQLINLKNKMKDSTKSLEQLIKIEDLNRESLPKVNFNFQLTVPSHHLECYDSTLDMVDASIHSFIILSACEFNKYYRDDWDWKGEFSHTMRHYQSSASCRSLSTKH